MTTSPNSTAHWMRVDLEQQIEQPLTRRDREDLARYGSEVLIRRLWIRAGAGLAGCAISVVIAIAVLTGPVAICLTLGAGLILLACAAGHVSRIRRIEAALDVEFVIRNDALDPERPRTRRERIALPEPATGTLVRRPERWHGRRARH